jgi:hypothetical protein
MKIEHYIKIQRAYIYLIALIVSLFAYGYQFPSENNFVELPTIYARLDPTLYTRDFYVQAQLEPGVRFFFDYFIITATRITNSVAIAYFCCYSLAFGSFILGVYHIARRLSHSRFTAGVSILLCLRGINVTLSEVDIFRTEPIPAIFAMSITIWGIYFALSRSWIRSYLCFGFATLLQFLVGLLPGLLVLPILIWETLQAQTIKRSIVSIAPPLGIFSLFTALVYIPLALNGLRANIQLDTAEFIRLYAQIRHPHHTLPSDWHVGEFLGFVIGGLLCLFSTKYLKNDDRNTLLTIIIGSLLTLLITYLFVEIYPNELIVKLQLGRTTPFLALALLLGISCLATELLHDRRYILAIITIVVPCISSGYILLVLIGLLVQLDRQKKISRKASQLASYFFLSVIIIEQYYVNLAHDLYTVSGVLCNVLLVLALLLPWLWEKMNDAAIIPIKYNFRFSLVVSSTLVLSIIIFGLGVTQQLLPNNLQGLFNQQLPVELVYASDVDTLSSRLKDEIPDESLVLVPPSNYHFRALSRKSVVFDFKSFPYTDWAIQKWGERLELLVGDIQTRPKSDQLDQRYCELDGLELIAIAQSFDATHILSNTSCHPSLNLTLIDQEGGWQLHQLKSSS